VTLAALRQDVVTALESAGLTAFPFFPERPVPPLAVVVPAARYVSQPDEARTFCTEFSVSLDVVLIMGRGTNQAALDALDAALETVIIALGNYTIDEVTVYKINLNAGQEHLAATCTITRPDVTIAEEG